MYIAKKKKNSNAPSIFWLFRYQHFVSHTFPTPHPHFFFFQFVSHTPWLPLFFSTLFCFLFFCALHVLHSHFSFFFSFLPYLFLAAPTSLTKFKTLSFAFSLSLSLSRRHRLAQPSSSSLHPFPPHQSLFSMVWLLLTWI